MDVKAALLTCVVLFLVLREPLRGDLVAQVAAAVIEVVLVLNVLGVL